VIQLTILSGQKAGTSCVARRFPVRIGRASGSELQLEEPGVWDQHISVEPVTGKGFVLKPHPPALVRVNGQPVEEARLRNGDLIELGNVRLQFWLAAAQQRRLRVGAGIAWGAIVLMTLSQIALLYWLVR
jgi:pSer/pThr/pTyr-binding forkhead associated (FHA) protein